MIGGIREFGKGCAETIRGAIYEDHFRAGGPEQARRGSAEIPDRAGDDYNLVLRALHGFRKLLRFVLFSPFYQSER